MPCRDPVRSGNQSGKILDAKVGRLTKVGQNTRKLFRLQTKTLLCWFVCGGVRA